MTFSFAISAIFLIYLIIWIQIPGMFFEGILLPRRLKISTRMLAAFFIGFIYIASVYFVESLFGIKYITMAAGPIISIIAIIKYFKKGRPSFFNADEKFSWMPIIIFGFIFVVSSLNVAVKYWGALSGETTQVYHDLLFHTGNIASLSRSFPSADIRISGLTFYYHYFYDLIFAICKHIFGMDAFRVYMNGNAFVTAWTLSLGLATLGERIRYGRICKGFNHFFYYVGLLVSCIALLPLNVAGTHFPLSWTNNHLFGNINAMGVSLCLSILVVEILTDLWYDKFSLGGFIALYLLSAAATGFKGTTGMLLVAITWAVFIIESIIVKKIHMNRFFYSLVMTLGFVFTYLIVTVGTNPSGSNNRALEFGPAGTLSISRVGQIFEKLGIDYSAFPWVIPALILLVLVILGPLVFAFTGFTIGKFKTLIREGVIGDIYDWFAIGSVIMGIIGYCFVNIPGGSQAYMVITNAGFIFYGAMKYIIANRRGFASFIAYLGFILGTCSLIFDIAYYIYDDVKQIKVYETEAGDDPSLVSSEVMEAYLWLRDNTPEDSVIAVDRFSEEIDYRSIYFYASAFSERQCYLEGYDYSDIDEKRVEAMLSINETFYSNESPRTAQMAMDMSGIDYLVVTETEHPDYEGGSFKVKLVFENDQVKIYMSCSDENLALVE